MTLIRIEEKSDTSIVFPCTKLDNSSQMSIFRFNNSTEEN